MEFKYLTQAIEKYYAEQEKTVKFYIKNGYEPTWSDDHKREPDNGLKRYLTEKEFAKYQSGIITRAQAIQKAQARAARELEKRKAKYCGKLEAAKNAVDVTYVSVSVEWLKSRTWGANPTATVTIYGERTTTGTASGCGYDKQSAAISEAFNKSPALLKALYTAEEKRLKGIKTRKQSRRDVIGYGSGYGILPYFEGGCGVSVYPEIFKNCGLKFEYGASGKMFDSYTIRKI